MLPEFWEAAWAEGKIGFHQSDVDAHLAAHWPTLDLPTGSRVLVPLCGKSLDLWWLRDRGHEVIGIELSESACQAFFDEAGVTPYRGPFGPFQAWRTDGLTLLQGNVFELPPDIVADAIYDRAATVALPTPMRDRYAELLATAAQPGAPMLLVTFDYPQQERDGPPFSVPPREVERLYAAPFTIERLAHHDGAAPAARFGVTRWATDVHRLTRR